MEVVKQHKHTKYNSIVSRSDTCSGDYTIAGTRIRVLDVINVINNGLLNEFLEDYDYITDDDIDQCIRKGREWGLL